MKLTNLILNLLLICIVHLSSEAIADDLETNGYRLTVIKGEQKETVEIVQLEEGNVELKAFRNGKLLKKKNIHTNNLIKVAKLAQLIYWGPYSDVESVAIEGLRTETEWIYEYWTSNGERGRKRMPNPVLLKEIEGENIRGIEGLLKFHTNIEKLKN